MVHYGSLTNENSCLLPPLRQISDTFAAVGIRIYFSGVKPSPIVASPLAQSVEHQTPTLEVVSSNLCVDRFFFLCVFSLFLFLLCNYFSFFNAQSIQDQTSTLEITIYILYHLYGLFVCFSFIFSLLTLLSIIFVVALF